MPTDRVQRHFSQVPSRPRNPDGFRLVLLTDQWMISITLGTSGQVGVSATELEHAGRAPGNAH